MIRTFKYLLALAATTILCGLLTPAAAQVISELRAFTAAVEEFEDGNYALAEKELAEFIRLFPQSAHSSEAVLYQGQAALKQKKYSAAVGLLSTNAASAGTLADQYRYYLAEAQLQSSNYQAAADSFASLIREFPRSNHLLAGSYGEALARFKLKEWTRVIGLLQDGEGTFHREALLRPADELASRGLLLLAEALIEHSEFAAAETTLGPLGEVDLLPESKWRRQYLLCRVRIAGHRLPEALKNTTNLLGLAAASGERALLAESIAMQGSILEQSGDLEEAIQAYEKNLAESVPAEYARQALLKISALTLARNNVADAAGKLETFLARHPDDAASEVVLLTLGELHLRQHFTTAAAYRNTGLSNSVSAPPNHLQLALENFEKIITNSPSGALTGRAELDKGWALWADGKLAQSQAAFQFAADQLPRSEEKAVARLKLGEAEFLQNDYTNALANFRSLLRDFSDLQPVKDGLFDQALYQIVRSSLAIGDLAGATAAMRQILQLFPRSFFSDRSMLLVGQHMAGARSPADARLVFQDLVGKYPESPLAAEINLAIARTYVEEKNWAAAIENYNQWLDHFGTNALRPEVEFNRAWATSQNGNETNALALFTNLIVRFPAHEMAARAQFWVASFYYNQRDFESAEKNFQAANLLQNASFLHQSLMMAGRAAIGRQGYSDAEKYFRALVEDKNCPQDVKVQAYMALGDTLILQVSERGKGLQKYEEAFKAFSKVPSLFPNHPLVPQAWGKIADCYLQLATVDSSQYDNATNYYQRILFFPAASLSARCQAEVGLGQALEAMARSTNPVKSPVEISALLDAAYNRYANVAYGKNLRDGEDPDVFWIKTAGFAAGKLAEDRKQWEIAVKLYRRLQDKLPPLREALETRIKRDREEQARLDKD